MEELAITRDWLRTKANSIEGGTSEVQLGMCFKNTKKIPNIIQTKIPPNSDPEIFEQDVLSSI